MTGTPFKVLRSDDQTPSSAAAPLPSSPARRFTIRRADTGPSTGPRRCAWRQRLVDAEAGLRLGFRMDGTLFVHLFVGCCVLAAGFVLGLSALQWGIVVLAITLVIATETFNQMLRALWSGVGHHLPAEVRDVARIGAAAVLLACIGSGTAIVLVFIERFRGG